MSFGCASEFDLLPSLELAKHMLIVDAVECKCGMVVVLVAGMIFICKQICGSMNDWAVKNKTCQKKVWTFVFGQSYLCHFIVGVESGVVRQLVHFPFE